MNTLLLDLDTWDLTVNSSGNIAVATGPYAIAQDVASAVRLFQGELWYDYQAGIPYFDQILGHLPSAQYMKSQFIAAGETVPEVASIKCFLTGPDRATRLVGGQLQIMDTLDGIVAVAGSDIFQGGAPWYVSGISPISE